MKIPAIKGKIGTRDYYITNLTFQQVSDCVSKIDDELHKSESLKDLIQRSITSNHISIKNYILNQPELFFNSLVLAVYDDYPEWVEIEVTYDDFETYQIGVLNFPTKHKIFPVDGQHRVEGIKAALKEDPSLSKMKIPAIFIGHKNDDNGMKKTRRLFSTLNRYAKPVTMDDIIALDEDDIVAINTRTLVEDYDLFVKKRVVYSKQKAISNTNLSALTSIITLYQCNLEIFKYYYKINHKTNPTKAKIDEYLKFRKSDKEIDAFYKFCTEFWDAFKNEISDIEKFLNIKENPAQKYRNSKGGNILFRPIGLLPFVKASIKIKQRDEGKSFKNIFKKLNEINLDITNKPWNYVVWNPISKKMIMNNSSLTELIFMYKYESNLLTESELNKLKSSYASKISYDKENLDEILNMI